DVGVFGDGGAVTCDPTGATQRCTRKILWLYGLTAYWRSLNDQLSWQGTLLEDKQDASGLVYRRNRYLDPQTGRFTQEDHLGLAGGMNLYGFAAGDPVNFSDPLGLCPEGVQADSARQTGKRETTLWCSDGSTEVRTGG